MTIDVFAELSDFEYRTLVLPLVSRSVKIGHRNMPHTFAYRDFQLIERLGLNNFEFSYTVPFRQAIAKGPYKDLYIKTFPKFIELYLDGTDGMLVDPMFGEFQVKPQQASIDTDILRRDGEDVVFSFIQSPDPDEEFELSVLSSVSGIVSDAGELEQAIGPIFNGVDIDELLSSISNFKNQFDSFGNNMAAKLGNTIRKLEELEESVTEPENFPLARAARNAQAVVSDFAAKAMNPAREVLQLLVTSNTTISGVGSKTGMTVEQLLALNPALALGGPMVTAGTTVKYWANASQQ